MMEQQGDVYLFQTADDGNICVQDGVVEMRGGLETSAYLSLFGGDESDAGDQNSESQWWGNAIEVEPSRRYRSRTQNLLRSIPATSGNLRRIEDAAKFDLKWFVDEGIATEITVAASIPSVNAVSIEISINAFGQETRINFIENWKADT